MIDALPVPPRYRKHAHKLFRTPAVRAVGRLATRSSRHDRWLFVIGCYDSGTTLFHDLLAQHPEIASLPGEGAFITGELHPPEDFGSVRLIYPVEDRIVGADSQADVARLRDDWGVFLSNKRPVALEKSISDLARLDWLADAFPQAKFVSIVRDGRAVAEGIRRRAGAGAFALPDGKDRHSMAECATQWVYALERTEALVERLGPERAMQTSYEELCHEPERVLASVVEFVGLPSFEPDLPSIANRNDASISRLTDEDHAAFDAVAGDDMRRLGYA